MCRAPNPRPSALAPPSSRLSCSALHSRDVPRRSARSGDRSRERGSRRAPAPLKRNDIRNNLTWTQNRSRGHAISHAESMMAWHTARSLNIGSWTATCILIDIHWDWSCKRKRKGRERRRRGERKSFLSFFLVWPKRRRERPFAPARKAGGGGRRESRSFFFARYANPEARAFDTKRPLFPTAFSLVDDITSTSDPRGSIKPKRAAAQANRARPKKKMKNCQNRKSEQRRAFIDD